MKSFSSWVISRFSLRRLPNRLHRSLGFETYRFMTMSALTGIRSTNTCRTAKTSTISKSISRNGLSDGLERAGPGYVEAVPTPGWSGEAKGCKPGGPICRERV